LIFFVRVSNGPLASAKKAYKSILQMRNQKQEITREVVSIVSHLGAQYFGKFLN
jgi:hypothetical protein